MHGPIPLWFMLLLHPATYYVVGAILLGLVVYGGYKLYRKYKK